MFNWNECQVHAGRRATGCAGPAQVCSCVQTIGFIGPRFSSVIGIIFLVVVLVSPTGLMGLWDRAIETLRRREPGSGGTTPVSSAPVGADL